MSEAALPPAARSGRAGSGPLSRALGQASALVWLRWTLWRRRLWQEKAFARVVLQAAGLLGGGALSLWVALAIAGEAAGLARSPREVAASGGPLAIAAAWLALGFAARLYIALLSLVRGLPFLEPRRFLPYAVPPRLVTAINLVAQMLEPAWLFFYPPAAALALGIARLPGAPGPLPLLLGVSLLIVAAAAVFQLLLAVAAEIVARRRLRRLLFVCFLGLATGFPFVLARLPEPAGGLSLEAVCWPWLRQLPPGWAVDLAAALSGGRPLDAAGDALLLAATFLAAAALAHRLSLRAATRPAETVKAARPGSGAPGWTLPLLSGPVSALVEKEIKTLLRAGWRQMVAAPIGFLLLRFGALRDGQPFLLGPEPLLVAAAYAHLGVLAYAVNCFGWDADATRAYFLWPVRGRTVLAAKNACAYAVSLLIFVVLGGLALLGGRLAPEQIAVGLLGHAATFPVLATVGNACSVWFATPMRSARMRRSPGGTTVLARLGTLLLLALAAWAPYALSKLGGPPILAAYLGELLVMGVAYGGLLAVSEQLLELRREPMLKALARDE